MGRIPLPARLAILVATAAVVVGCTTPTTFTADDVIGGTAALGFLLIALVFLGQVASGSPVCVAFLTC